MPNAYPEITKESLIMLLYEAIGNGGTMNDPPLQSLVFYYAFTLKIAPPSIIKAELERAKNLGLIDIDQRTSIVSFTQKGLDEIKEHDITMDSFINPSFLSKKNMEKKMKEINDPAMAMQFSVKIKQLADRIAQEGLLWKGPPEWVGSGWGAQAKPMLPGRKEIAITADFKITKAPPKPRKLE
jgi:hypothetical protein